MERNYKVICKICDGSSKTRFQSQHSFPGHVKSVHEEVYLQPRPPNEKKYKEDVHYTKTSDYKKIITKKKDKKNLEIEDMKK
jgi:hypothetical protein